MTTEKPGASLTLAIRNLGADDAAVAAQLSGQLGYPVSKSEMRGRLERAAGNPERRVLGAFLNHQIVGWIDASVEQHLQSQDTVVIGGLVVGDGSRNLGVGRRLCHEIELWARGKRIGCIRVRSQVIRERAHRFYLRDGYRQVKTSHTFEKILD